VVVSYPYRRHRIGARLLTVARQWASEHGLIQILAEIHTQNHPGIAFCQQAGLKFCGFNEQYFPNHDIAIFFGQSLR
jgi:GNAT superfamily N-acetyltransferase